MEVKKYKDLSNGVKGCIFIILFIIFIIIIVSSIGNIGSSTKNVNNKSESSSVAQHVNSTLIPTAVPTPVPTISSTQTPQASLFPPASKTTNCHENNGLPDMTCTPGAVDSRVTQVNIKSTICVSGYTSTVRPSTTYTNNLKRQQIIAYGYSDTNLSDYEEDHFIPLEIGG